jgi:phytoene dehydrogenase-like protein
MSHDFVNRASPHSITPLPEPDRFDIVVIGGGHNGLVAAAYLAKAGLRTVILESRPILGGPVGTFEFLPGYRTAFSNSPGSFEPRVASDLGLENHGLRFRRPDPTLVHRLASGLFIGWRDRARVEAQLEASSPGEAERYSALLRDLELLARELGISIYRPAPDLDEARSRLSGAQLELFDAVFHGSLCDLLDWRLRSPEAKTLLGMIGLNVTMARPSEPGTAAGLMLRPVAMASSPETAADDPQRSALRGSTGLPIGGMGAMVDALERSCRSLGVEIRVNARVVSILSDADGVSGVACLDGRIVEARTVLSAINPRAAFRLLGRGAVPENLLSEIDAKPLRGSAFKLVLALDGVPRYSGLPDDLPNDVAAATQFRLADSLDHIESVVASAQAGMLPERPLVWGLIPTLTTPSLAPPGRQLLSANVWHAPYQLSGGQTWDDLRDDFRDRCIDTISELMPNLRDRIVDAAVMTPVEIERELDLEQSHITHGDMLTDALFGPRPHRLANDYRTPLTGFYLTGSGTWPGGYVTGIPGLNASSAILEDLAVS